MSRFTYVRFGTQPAEEMTSQSTAVHTSRATAGALSKRFCVRPVIRQKASRALDEDGSPFTLPGLVPCGFESNENGSKQGAREQTSGNPQKGS